MKIEVDENGFMELTEVFNEITLVTADNESMVICMRDTGFEFRYQGVYFEAKNGKVNPCGEE